MRAALVPVLGLALVPLLTRQDPAPGAPDGIDAATLFRTNCASCHGETGAGDGWTRLDRPARSFADGGFSYGNTPGALLRTITNGIPGTPMPAFGSSLTEDERRALAAHVVTLGPPIEVVDPADTVLVVRERPEVVRGHLPPIVEGAPERVRGLLIGLPDGLTFEYRADDVRLVGIRLGGFVERTDWIGRGGTPLRPLGTPVLVFDGGDPPGPWHALGRDIVDEPNERMPLESRLAGSFVRGADAGVAYALHERRSGRWLGRVEESVGAFALDSASGWRRRLVVTDRHPDFGFRHRAFDLATNAETLVATAGVTWTLSRAADGVGQLRGVRTSRPWSVRVEAAAGFLEVVADASADGPLEVEVLQATVPACTDEVVARLKERLR